MRTFKIYDYEMPAVIEAKYSKLSNDIDIDGWEKIKLGTRLQIPAYFYPASHENIEHPYPDNGLQCDYIEEVIVQYRHEYNGFILSIANLNK